MIYCCGGYFAPIRTVFLFPNFEYRDRKLEVLVCPKCGALVAELTQFNVKTQEYETFRPKRKKVSKFLQEVENGKWQEVKVKYGSKGGQGFVYGLNRESKSGKIYQYAVDFHIVGVTVAQTRAYIIAMKLPVRIESDTKTWVHIDLSSYSTDFKIGLFNA